MQRIYNYIRIDWILFLATIPLLAAGLVSMRSFGVETDYFFIRQILWIIFGFSLFFIFSFIDWRFLRRTEVVISFYLLLNFFLLLLLAVGGGFIYIAAVDLLPELHQTQNFKKAALQLFFFLLGIGVIWTITNVFAH